MRRRTIGAPPPKYVGKTAVVVGGGPSGSMAASYLAQHGFVVKVYERRGDPAENAEPSKRAQQIAIGDEAVEVMKTGGVELPENGFRHTLHRRYGSTFYSPLTSKFISTTLTQAVLPFTGERNGITAAITSDVKALHGDRVHFKYGQTCKAIDFGKQRIFFEDESGLEIAESYDLLVGADGRFSFVRQEMQKIDRSLKVTHFDGRTGYKLVRNLPCLSEDEPFMSAVKPGWLTSIPVSGGDSVVGKPLKFFVVLTRPAEDGVNALLAGSQREAFELIKGVEYKALKELLPQTFPNVWIKIMSQQLQGAPYSKIGGMMRVSKFYGPATVLIGDAAHAIPPDFGRGTNMAISDSKYLYNALDIADGDIDAAGSIFHSLRAKHVQDIQTMQMWLGHENHVFPLLSSWEKFAAWVYTNVRLRVDKKFPSLKLKFAGVDVMSGKLKAGDAVAAMKRDACVFAAGLIVSAALLVKGFLLTARHFF